MSNPAVLASVEDWHLTRWMVSYAVNALWQAPMVAAAAWAVSRMMRRAGPRAEHMLWVGALLVMVALPAVPRLHLPHHDTATVTMVTDDYDLSSLPPLAPAAQPWWVPEIGLATLPRGLVMTLLLCYFGAGLYFALRLGWSLWRTAMLVREAEEAEFAPESEAVWERCRDAFALDEVRRLVSCDIACPVTVGRATVLVPAGFVESAAAEELLTAMAHECAHLRRRDFWKNVAYELATLPIAFHPMLWMVKRQIAETREMVCDGAAVERLVTPQSYVRSLLRLAEGVVGPSMGLAAMGMFDGRTLERRIVSMKMRRAKMSWARRAMVLSAALVAGVAVIAGGALLAVAVEAKAVPVASQQVSESASQPVSQVVVPETTGSAQSLQPQTQTQTGEVNQPCQPVNRHLTEEQRTQQQQELKQEIQRILMQQQDAAKAAAKAMDAARPTVEQKQRLDELNARVKELMQRRQTLPQLTPEQKLKMEELTRQMQQNALLYQATSKEYQAKVEELRRQFGLYERQNYVAEYRTFLPPFKQQRFDAEYRTFLPPFKGAPPAAAASAAPQGADVPMRISGGVAAGSKISGEDAEYPPIARAAHVQGAVVLHAIISKEGAVENLEVISGPQMLQNAAMKAVRTWRFRPYFLKDEPTKVETTITVNFALNDEKPTAAASAQAAAVAPQSGERAQRISGGVIAGTKISGDDPSYPPIARAAHITGTVVLHVIISGTGTVENMEVISGPQMLQNAAMEAVKTWRYKPYYVGNNPTAVDTTVSVNFSIDRGKPEAPVVLPPQGASTGETLFRVGGEVSPPRVVLAVSPEMPVEARKAKFAGNVLVYLIVDAQGKPQNVRVLKPVGMGLDEQAMAAVKKYQFAPAMKQGRPVPVELSIEVDFEIF